MARNIKNKARMNLDDTQDVIAEMRQDISKLRDKIASAPEPKRDDVSKMEVCSTYDIICFDLDILP